MEARVNDMMDQPDLAGPYLALAKRLPEMAAHAPLTFCGMSACIDATLIMSEMKPLLQATEPPEAVAFANLLKDRAARGIGGEIRVEWPAGPAFISERLTPRYSLGGTGPHAGWVLSALNAPAVINLEDRNEHMLTHLPTGLLLAEGGELVLASSVPPRGERRPNVYIFEYTAGVPIAEVVPTRSTRIIVRFNDPGLEHDDEFDAVTRRLASSAGSGLIAGFNCVPASDLNAEFDRVFGLTRHWRDAGLTVIHLEMSGFETAANRDRVLEALPGTGVTSLGMSQSEFVDIRPEAKDETKLAAEMLALAERLHLRRVCVHADHWAASVTLDDPEIERDALMAGCLLASSRAAAGRPVSPEAPPAGASFRAPPFGPIERNGRWNLVAVPSPYIAKPATTLGLGDTFTAGCLLVLGTAGGRKR